MIIKVEAIIREEKIAGCFRCIGRDGSTRLDLLSGYRAVEHSVV